MENLYKIEQDLIALYDKIEEQGGELLPEDEQQLNITKENFMNKMEGYNSYIHKLDNDIVACKEEENRIKSLRKSMESRKNTAKKTVLNAVMSFGIQTNNGGYIIEFPTFKFSTRRSESIIEDELRLKYFKDELIRLIEELDSNGVLTPNIEYNLEGICNTINANIEAEMKANGDGVYFIPFTETDLELINIEIVSKINVASLFKKETGIEKTISNNEFSKLDISVDKITAKSYLNEVQDINIISCCNKVANYSLQMK